MPRCRGRRREGEGSWEGEERVDAVLAVGESIVLEDQSREGGKACRKRRGNGDRRLNLRKRARSDLQERGRKRREKRTLPPLLLVRPQPLIRVLMRHRSVPLPPVRVRRGSTGVTRRTTLPLEAGRTGRTGSSRSAVTARHDGRESGTTERRGGRGGRGAGKGRRAGSGRGAGGFELLSKAGVLFLQRRVSFLQSADGREVSTSERKEEEEGDGQSFIVVVLALEVVGHCAHCVELAGVVVDCKRSGLVRRTLGGIPLRKLKNDDLVYRRFGDVSGSTAPRLKSSSAETRLENEQTHS